MNRGYVKLWRKSMDSGMLQNAELWTFWSWCLLKATHKPIKQHIGYQEVELEPGQFVFGRIKAAHELQLTERKIRTCLDSLRKRQNVTIKTTNKFSIITIVNWPTYQGEDCENDQQTVQPVTSKRPANDHKQTHKHKRIKTIGELPAWLNLEAWESFRQHRKELKKPMTPKAEKLNIDKLAAFEKKGINHVDIINQSICNGYQGLFELKAGNNGSGHPRPVLVTEDPTYKGFKRV